MESCRNVIMEFVYREANAQINALGMGIKDQYNIHEVAAYALNRLPAMFVSTDIEMRNKKSECSLMQTNISKVVRQALLGVRRDPLRQPQPLEEIELANAPYALLKTQEILNWKSLVWSDLPMALENCLEEALGQHNSGNTVNLNRYGSLSDRRINPHVYLKKAGKALQNKSVVPEVKQKEYDTYMLESNQLAHALERLVIRMAQNRAQNFPSAELRFIRLEDVLTKTLNRLPPLYATSEKGLNHLRYYAQMNIGSELAIIVHESMLEVRKKNLESTEPLIYYRIRHEREQALLKVSNMLKRDVKWQNLREVVFESLERAKSGKICWVRSPAKAAVSSV